MVQPKPSPRPSAIRVLHVDDEATHLEYAKTFLEMADEIFHIESVASPEKALRLLKSETYDCIVSDFQMSTMDGIELARRVRETSNIPFILYTGRGSEEVAEAAFAVGIDDYIRKEIDPSHYRVLTRRIRIAVEKHRAERALQRQLNEMQIILDSVPAIIFYKDKENRLVKINQALIDSSGLSREELEGRDLVEIYPDLANDYWRDDLEVMNTGLAKRGIVEPLETPGGVRWLATDKIPYRDEREEITGVIGFSIDITERKRMDEGLKASEERYRSLVENSPDSISVSIGSEIVYVNRKRLELTGHSHQSELIGSNGLVDVFPEDREEILKRIQARERGEVIASVQEFRLLRGEGSIVHVIDHTSDIVWEGREAIMHILHDVSEIKRFEGDQAVITYARDITESKRMEDEAKLYQKQLAALHSSSFRLSKHDHLDGMFMESLEIIKDVLGFQYLGIAQIKGDEITYDAAVAAYQPGDFTIPLNQPSIVGRVFKTGKAERISDTRLDPDYYFAPIIHEAERRLSLLAVPVLVEGEVAAVIDVEDVEIEAFSEEDRKILEILAEHMSSAIRRIQSQRKIQELHEVHARELLDGVQRVSSMVRHDLRGPLQTIMNAAYVAESNPERTAEMMEIIMRSVKHQSDVMEDWKSQDLEETMKFTETDLSQLISDALAASLIPTHITVDVNTDPMKVNLDKVKMRRVMDNLIRNATEAMEDGGTLIISARGGEHGIIIEVSDTGIGIPEAERKNIFKPFYTTKPGGVGLGLTYSRRTVEAHGGNITVESEEGKGSTFRISLPHLREE